MGEWNVPELAVPVGRKTPPGSLKSNCFSQFSRWWARLLQVEARFCEGGKPGSLMGVKEFRGCCQQSNEGRCKATKRVILDQLPLEPFWCRCGGRGCRLFHPGSVKVPGLSIKSLLLLLYECLPPHPPFPSQLSGMTHFEMFYSWCSKSVDGHPAVLRRDWTKWGSCAGGG